MLAWPIYVRIGNNLIKSLISRALSNSKPMIISDPKNHQTLLQLSKNDIRIKSLALIPLVSANRAIGLIYMDNRLLMEIFSRRDIMIMTAIATQLSLAFSASMLSKQLEGFKSSFQEVESYSMPVEEIAGTFSQIICGPKYVF